jgi:phage gp46-like protein
MDTSPVPQAEILVGLPRALQRIHLEVVGYVEAALAHLLQSGAASARRITVAGSGWEATSIIMEVVPQIPRA